MRDHKVFYQGSLGYHLNYSFMFKKMIDPAETTGILM